MLKNAARTGDWVRHAQNARGLVEAPVNEGGAPRIPANGVEAHTLNILVYFWASVRSRRLLADVLVLLRCRRPYSFLGQI